MYTSLCEKVKIAISALKPHINVSEMVGFYNEFVAVSKNNSGGNKKQAVSTNNRDKLNEAREAVKNKRADQNKRQVYREHLKKVQEEGFWTTLLSENEWLSEDAVAEIQLLKRHFIEIPSMELYSLPLSLILLKLNYLTQIQHEIDLFQKGATNTINGDDIKDNIATIYNKLSHLNDCIIDLIKLHVQTLISKIEVLKSNPAYVDDPLPYVIGTLEKFDISHTLPRYTWAPERKPSAKVIENAFNAISLYGNGAHLLRLEKVMSSEHKTKLFNLTEKRHSNSRYNTIYPLELAKYVEVKKPRFPSIQIGAHRRFEFFSKSWVPLHEMNSLVNDINFMLSKPYLTAENCQNVVKSLFTLKELMNQHEEFFNAQKIPENALFNRFFRKDTLDFQSIWANALISVKGKIRDVHLNIAEKLIDNAYALQKSQFVYGNSYDGKMADQIKSDLEKLLDKQHLNLPSNTVSLRGQKERHEKLCSYRDYVLSAPCFATKQSEKYRILKFSEAVILGVQEGTLDEVKGCLNFAVFSQAEKSDRFVPTLKDLSDIQETIKLNMDSEIIRQMLEPERSIKYKQILTAFRHLVLGSLGEKNETDLDRLYKEKYKLASTVSTVLDAINKAFIKYNESSTWKWPIDKKVVDDALQKHGSEFKFMLTSYMQKKGRYLLKGIEVCKKKAWDKGDMKAVVEMDAVNHFVNSNFGACAKIIASQSKVVNTRPTDTTTVDTQANANVVRTHNI